MPKKPTLGNHINELGEMLRALETQISEIEAQINHPLRSPAEKRKLRARWEKIIDECGLRQLFATVGTDKRRPRIEDSGKVIGEALFLKQQAKFFEDAGRMSDAKQMRTNAQRLEKRGKELRSKEIKNN